MACDHESQVNDASALCCIPPNLHAAVQTYLLAKIRGGSMEVGEILRDSACLSSCIPPGLMPRIKTYLMCQLANAGGTPTPIPEPVCDADAQAFITTAGITVPAQQEAICRFVASLKSQGTPPFWDSEIILYPFVGGAAAPHSYNLIDPTAFQLTYHGVPAPTHGALGMLGNAATAYANTHYVPRTGPPAINTLNCRMYLYLYDQDNVINHSHVGARSDAAVNRLQIYRSGAAVIGFSLNSNGAVGLTLSVNGAYLAQTSDGANEQMAYNGAPWTNIAFARTNSPSNEMLMLAHNVGVFPAVIPTFFSSSRICGFSIGSRALTAAEWPLYHSIWQTFQAELGRQRP